MPRAEAETRARELLAKVGLEQKAGAYPQATRDYGWAASIPDLAAI